MNTLRTFLKIYKIELPDKIEIDIPKIMVKKEIFIIWMISDLH